MRLIGLLVCALLVAAVPAFAADVTGTWNGTLTPDNGSGNSDSAQMVLKQDGEKVSGTAGPAGQPYPILNGAIKEDQVTFELETPDGRVLSFVLKISGDELTGRGEMRRNGQVIGTATLSLKRN